MSHLANLERQKSKKKNFPIGPIFLYLIVKIPTNMRTNAKKNKKQLLIEMWMAKVSSYNHHLICK